ncbi:MAG: hypothetical protein ABIH99_05040 [Candidatus Micrarchaeota archaeon]
MKYLVFAGAFLVLLLLFGCTGGAGEKKTGVIDSADLSGFIFSTGEALNAGEDHNWENVDISAEPWCTTQAGMCGNWSSVGKKELEDVTKIPTSGFISEKFDNCMDIKEGYAYVVKTKDGSYAKMKIISDEYTEKESRCDHKITFEYMYPFSE